MTNNKKQVVEYLIDCIGYSEDDLEDRDTDQAN